MNRLKTTFLLTCLTLLLVAMGSALGGKGGAIVAFVIAGAATAHLFIANPLTCSGLLHLFSTHPPMEERFARLKSQALGTGRSSPTGLRTGVQR